MWSPPPPAGWPALQRRWTYSANRCPTLDRLTAIGALATYISDHTVAKFQPMNVNFGIIEPLGYKIKGKREKNTKISERALEQIEKLKGEL